MNEHTVRQIASTSNAGLLPGVGPVPVDSGAAGRACSRQSTGFAISEPLVLRSASRQRGNPVRVPRRHIAGAVTGTANATDMDGHAERWLSRSLFFDESRDWGIGAAIRRLREAS